MTWEEADGSSERAVGREVQDAYAHQGAREGVSTHHRQEGQVGGTAVDSRDPAAIRHRPASRLLPFAGIGPDHMGGRGLMACGPEPGVCGLVGRWRPRGGRGADMLWGPGACRPPAPGPGLPGRGRPPGGGAGAPAAGGQVRRARERAGRPQGAARPPAAGLPGVGVVLCLCWWQSRCGRRVWQVTLLCEVSGSRPVVLS